jgi:23S rRNA maturation mini-RNase III
VALLQLYIRRSFFCPPKRLHDYHGLVKENARAEQQVRGRATTSCLAKARELRTATLRACLRRRRCFTKS